METAKKVKQNTGTQLKLQLIKGGLYPSTKKEIASENLWLICKAAFWNTQLFAQTEEQTFKELIAEHFKGSRNLDVTFKQLVERVCLAKRYLTRRKGRYISKPIDWLNINYKNGLSGTAKWYKDVNKQRASVPHYNEGITVLAKGLLKYAENRNILDLLNYRRELIELKQYDLVQLYMNSIMHIQYLNF